METCTARTRKASGLRMSTSSARALSTSYVRDIVFGPLNHKDPAARPRASWSRTLDVSIYLPSYLALGRVPSRSGQPSTSATSLRQVWMYQRCSTLRPRGRRDVRVLDLSLSPANQYPCRHDVAIALGAKNQSL